MPTKPLHIVQVLPAMNTGGVERGVIEVAEGIQDYGWRSTVIASSGPLKCELKETGSDFLDWSIGKKSPLTMRWIGSLKRWILKNNPDVLHVRSRVPMVVAWHAWKGLPLEIRPRLISTVHGMYSISFASRAMVKAEVVVAVSESTKEYILKNYKINEDRIRVIHRGVNRNVYKYGWKPDFGWTKKFSNEIFCSNLEKNIDKCPPYLLLAGRFTSLKNHSFLIEAMGKIKDIWPELQVVMIGSEKGKRSKYIQKLKKIAFEKNVSSKVHFLGYRKDLREIIASCFSLVSISSKPESFGRTVLEALSLGVPVVGFNEGGVGEQLQNLFPWGLLERSEGVDGFVRKIVHLRDQRYKIQEEHPYTKEQMIFKICDLYQELANAK